MVLLICLCGAKFADITVIRAHAVDKGHFYKCGSTACGALFRSSSAVKDHQKSVHHHGPVATLALLQDHGFEDESGEVASFKCVICGPNKKPFKDTASLSQHMADKHPNHSTCPTCKQTFEAKSQRLGHQKDARHCYCEEHNLVFRTIDDFKTHLREELHATVFQCLDCGREFGTQHGLDDHLLACPAANKEVVPEQSERARAAFAAVEEANLRCEKCNRTFESLKALRQHKGSVKHKPVANFTCNVLPAKCNQRFTSYSAWFFHVESGKCKSGMTRKKLYAMVHSGDSEDLITYARNKPGMRSISDAGLCSYVSVTGSRVSELEDDLERISISESAQNGVILTPNGSEDFSDISSNASIILPPNVSDATSEISSASGVILTPSVTVSRSRSSSISGVILTPPDSVTARSEWSFVTDSHKLTPATTSVDGSSTETITYENLGKVGKGWPCPVCNRPFRNKERLLQHLKSPAHDPKLFHCPSATSLGLSFGKPEKAFKTLSGLAQHVEAGACDGGVDLLKKFIDICQDKSKLALGSTKNLINGAH